MDKVGILKAKIDFYKTMMFMLSSTSIVTLIASYSLWKIGFCRIGFGIVSSLSFILFLRFLISYISKHQLLVDELRK